MNCRESYPEILDKHSTSNETDSGKLYERAKPMMCKSFTDPDFGLILCSSFSQDYDILPGTKRLFHVLVASKLLGKNVYGEE